MINKYSILVIACAMTSLWSEANANTPTLKTVTKKPITLLHEAVKRTPLSGFNFAFSDQARIMSRQKPAPTHFGRLLVNSEFRAWVRLSAKEAAAQANPMQPSERYYSLEMVPAGAIGNVNLSTALYVFGPDQTRIAALRNSQVQAATPTQSEMMTQVVTRYFQHAPRQLNFLLNLGHGYFPSKEIRNAIVRTYTTQTLIFPSGNATQAVLIAKPAKTNQEDFSPAAPFTFITFTNDTPLLLLNTTLEQTFELDGQTYFFAVFQDENIRFFELFRFNNSNQIELIDYLNCSNWTIEND